MKRQKGFSLVEGLLIVLILSVVGFAGYTVWTNQQDEKAELNETVQQIDESKQLNNESSQNSAEVATSVNYSNDEFGFSFEYPLSLEVNDPEVRAGYEDSGKTVFFSIDNDIYVKSNTSDYSIGPKGPIPLSGIAANGYTETSGVFYYSDGTSELTADKIVDRGDYIYIENRVMFQPDDDTVEYIALFNTSEGGLVIYTENPDKVSIIDEIARSVNTN